MHSARAVAKTMLELAQEQGISLTNLTLQKLLYLAHGLLLARTGQPLVDESFQAWKYGPVLESLYHDFKIFGQGPISPQSWYVNHWHGLDAKSVDAIEALTDVLRQCGKMSGGQLIEFTHAPNGPWAAVYSENRKGIEIQNNAISSYFKTIAKN